MKNPQVGSCIEVSQQKAIDKLEEIPVERNRKEELHCTPAIHTIYKSLLGQINRLKLDDDEDDKPLVRPDGTTVSEEKDEDEKPSVQLISVLKRESFAKRSVLMPL